MKTVPLANTMLSRMKIGLPSWRCKNTGCLTRGVGVWYDIEANKCNHLATLVGRLIPCLYFMPVMYNSGSGKTSKTLLND